MALHPLMLASAVFTVDQLSKFLILRQCSRGRAARFGPWVLIRPVLNSHGLGSRMSGTGLLLMWVSLMIAVALLVRYGELFRHDVAQIGLGLAAGGATGNLVDRLRRGAIIDFIDLGWWPVFNLADAAIVVGAALAVWFMR